MIDRMHAGDLVRAGFSAPFSESIASGVIDIDPRPTAAVRGLVIDIRYANITHRKAAAPSAVAGLAVSIVLCTENEET
jgi:hypothetical protein